VRVSGHHADGLVSVPDIPKLDLAVVSTGHNLVWLVGVEVNVTHSERVSLLDHESLSAQPPTNSSASGSWN